MYGYDEPNFNINLPVSNNQNTSAIHQYALKKQIDINAEVLKDGIHTANRMAEADYKHQLALQREVRRAELSEEHYRGRQLATRSIAENSDGFLMMELIYPNGKHHFSEPICPERYFRANYFFAADSALEEEVLQIIWQGEAQGIFLCGNKMTAKAMGKAFLERGVAFRIPRRVRQEMLEQIFAFLRNRAKKIEVPRCVGWTKNSAGAWIFEKEGEKTLEGMRYGE